MTESLTSDKQKPSPLWRDSNCQEQASEENTEGKNPNKLSVMNYSFFH